MESLIEERERTTLGSFVRRDSVGKEQLLQPLSLFERRLHPQVRRPRQHPFKAERDPPDHRACHRPCRPFSSQVHG
jgi:hypothetical protein